MASRVIEITRCKDFSTESRPYMVVYYDDLENQVVNNSHKFCITYDLRAIYPDYFNDNWNKFAKQAYLSKAITQFKKEIVEDAKNVNCYIFSIYDLCGYIELQNRSDGHYYKSYYIAFHGSQEEAFSIARNRIINHLNKKEFIITR